MKHKHVLLNLALVASLFSFASLAAGCGGDDDGGGADAAPMADAGPADATPACEEAKTHSDFAFINEKIFQKSCANFSACHDATQPAGKLDLTTANAYASLVDKAADENAAKMLVQSGATSETDCMNSYLYNKVSGIGLESGKKTMPLNSPLLCQEKIDAICRWIAAGSPAQ